MGDNSILLFKCLNPQCGQIVKMRRPAKSGIYPVTCPHCGIKKNLKLKGLDTVQEQNPAAGVSQPGNTAAPLMPPPIPDNSAKPAIMMEDDFVCGESYKFVCPHCGKQEIGFNTNKPGLKEFPCPHCKGHIKVDVRAKTRKIDETSPLQLMKGRLVLLRKGWLNKNYSLSEGHNIVGRYDDEEASDIAIKGDNTMSRRSIDIKVEYTSRGYTFKLTVMKATNPVLHNDAELMKGESVSLNFGDSITVGKTKFRFEKEK
ncbi:MAG: hypothetical protein Q4F07_05770 [Bacteroidales bacterium]|nr:hypothetical protein [Bacteroidales bacterium]